jgi:hypothetical protein
MNRSALEHSTAAPWIGLLLVSASGETVAFISAVIFGVSAFGQTDAVEQSRLWASAGWLLLAMLAFTAVSIWSLVRLLRTMALQAPRTTSEPSEP